MAINMACCLRTNTFVFPLLVVLQLTHFHQMRSERYATGGHTIVLSRGVLKVPYSHPLPTK